MWVIAETTETPTRFARIVVTDDRGRYVVPDLPQATYQVFVRGYGLVDSARVNPRSAESNRISRHKSLRTPERPRRCFLRGGGSRC